MGKALIRVLDEDNRERGPYLVTDLAKVWACTNSAPAPGYWLL